MQYKPLVISATAATIQSGPARADEHLTDRTTGERTADELIVLARRTAARVRFVEDPSLLTPIGGAGAFLQFRL